MSKSREDMFLEEVEKDYQEAVIGKQISPEAREKVAASRTGHKKSTSRRLGLLQKVMTKDFHLLPPEQKKKITDGLGFGKNEKVKNEGGYKLIEGSAIHPDVLYYVTNDSRGDIPGKVFIYNIANGEDYASIDEPYKTHWDAARSADSSPSNRDVREHIHGRVIALEYDLDEDDENAPNLERGTHLSFWRRIDKDLVDEVIREYNLDPDFVHMPSM